MDDSLIAPRNKRDLDTLDRLGKMDVRQDKPECPLTHDNSLDLGSSSKASYFRL